tara:strand:- start:446 stop:3643 length:3198 start_codon:yes stop_codon:yes gene_type:complete
MPIWSPALFFASTSDTAYTIQDSVMLDGSADYLTLTPSFNALDNTKVTFSWWQKRSTLSTVSWLYDAGSNNDQMQFAAADDLEVSLNATTDAYLNTTALFRDPTAWQNFVVSFDTGNSTSGDRMRIWNNGTEITAFDTDTMPSAGYALDFLANGIVQNLGRRGNNSQFWGGYLAEFIGLDGISVTDASKFGETNDDGIWIPKDPSDTDNIADWGGSNSFWLKFADATNLGFNSRPTAVTAVAETYKIDNSLWLDGSADYLSRTPSSTGTPKTQTFSFWTKANVTSGDTAIFGAWPDDSNHSYIDFNGGGAGILRTAVQVSGSNKLDLRPTPVYLDTTAWKHWVFIYDFTNEVSTDRCRVYRNGVRINAFGTATYPATTDTPHWATSGTPETIGAVKPSSPVWFANIYLADFIRLDGYAAEPTDFGGWNATGDWVPIDPTSFVTSNKGTNGFHLDFADPSAPGNDISGNNNDFAANGTIATTQTTTDSPTNTSGDNEGNYATLNPLSKSSGGATTATISEGNTRWLRPNDGSNNQQCYATFGADEGKFYFEFKLLQANNGFDTGLFAEGEINGNEGAGYTGYDVQGYYLENYGTGVVWKVTTADGSGGGSRTDTGDSCTANDVMKIAVDFDAGKIWLGNVTQDTYYNSSGADVAFNTSTPTFTFTANTRLFPYIFGHAQINEAKFRFNPALWTGSAPTGFKPWNTSELPSPTVTDPRAYWSNSLYYGTAQNRSVRQCFDSTGTAWTPDFVWIKGRSHAGEHVLLDSVRGVTKVLTPDSNAAEFTDTKSLTSFDEGGFTLGVGDDRNDSNDDGKTYVAWCMKAGGAASSNGNGSITSSVSAANHGGFSIATWTGNGSAGATIGHGLSRKPAMGIFRRLSLAQDWAVYHEGLDASAPEDKYVNLNLTNDVQDATWLNDTAPTTSVWTLGTSGYVNTSSETFVGYFFARTPGLIGIGTYTGNNSTDGPMVTIDDGASGFRPAWLMIKEYSGSNNGNWFIRDSARNPYNPTDLDLMANSTDAQYTDSNSDIDFTANGFKIRSNAGGYNESGAKNLYIAFADQPFNLARAR